MSVIDHSAFAQAAGLPPRQACGACREGQKLPFEFTMAFQPIIDLRSGGAWGYEALVRGTAGEPAGSIRGAWYPYLWPFNLSGHPAVSLPCGWSADGLPIGLQIVGPWYADRRVLALAAQLERERPCGRPMPV